MTMTDFEIFRKKWSYFVLMMIRDNPGITKVDLMRERSPGPAKSIFEITCNFYEMGLIKYYRDPKDREKKGQWNCLHMYLTEKGQIVASYLEKNQQRIR